MTRPKHLFIAHGNLYDSRRRDRYPCAPLRQEFECHVWNITNTQQLKATLRYGEFIWPGKYRVAFTTAERTVLSFAAVRREWKQVIRSIRSHRCDAWRVNGLIYLERIDDPVYCDHTGEQLSGPPPFEHDAFCRCVALHGRGDPTYEAFALAEELAAKYYDYSEIAQIVVERDMVEQLD